jgi:hypothetical protein
MLKKSVTAISSLFGPKWGSPHVHLSYSFQSAITYWAINLQKKMISIIFVLSRSVVGIQTAEQYIITY